MESVDGDDDLFVVIVGNEDDSALDADRRVQVSNIKQEALDEDTAKVPVENIIKTVEKYGQAIKIEILKQEPDDDLEYLENQDEYIETHGEYLEPKNQYPEPQEEFLEPQYDFENAEDDEEYIPESEEYSEEEFLDVQSEGLKKSVKKKSKSRRYKMRTPEDQQSFVKELCEEYPELKEDQELLIDTLGRIMLEIKRPEPPKDYFIMNSVMFECVECGAISETIPAAARHWQEKHGPRYLICFACGVDFRSTTNLYKHEKRCNAPDAVLVLKARARTLGPKGRGRPFLSDVSMRSCYSKNLKPQIRKQFPCSECAAVFLSKQSLRSHELKHSGSRPYRCSECPAAYTSACGLSRHRTKHSNVRFVCDHCQRPFRNKAALVVHFDTHNPLRKYPCGECGRRFAQKMALQLHVAREHRLLPPPCACQICPKRYPRMSLLKAHMLKEHGMSLITQNMFYKTLPMLSDTQLQKAKVVLKSDVNETIRQEISQIQPADRDLSHELVKYLWDLRAGDAQYGQGGQLKCERERKLEGRLDDEDNKDHVWGQIQGGMVLEGHEQILCETSGFVLKEKAKVI